MQKTRGLTDIYEISLSGPSNLKGAAEILDNVLLFVHVNPRRVVHSDNGYIFRVTIHCKSKNRAEKIKKRLLKFRLKGISVKLRALKRKDWQDKWKEGFHTFSITKTIDVVPLWEKAKYRSKKRTPIFINPRNTFGTGLHETTRFMAHLIEQRRGHFKSFLDIGTGTGILSLVALKCQANDVWAVDIDANCIRAAKENLSLNGHAFVETNVGDISRLRSKQRFDFVAANLITHDLIRLKRKIFSFIKPRQYLAVSGVAIENLDIFKKAYRELPLRLLRMKRGKQWVALLYKRMK